MGCGDSTPISPDGGTSLGVIVGSAMNVNQNQQWKVKPTRTQAKKTYIEDGSLTESNA